MISDRTLHRLTQKAINYVVCFLVSGGDGGGGGGGGDGGGGGGGGLLRIFTAVLQAIQLSKISLDTFTWAMKCAC